MKNIQIRRAIIIVFTMGIISCSSGVTNNQNTTETVPASQPAEVKKLPSFTMTDVNGNSININSFKGKKVFVNLWASWCPPCRAEIPSIEKLSSKISKEKVVFVMLSLDESFDKAKQFKESNNLNLPVYYPSEELPAIFNTQGIPATFIFNEKGELIKANNGADDYDTDSYLQLLKS